MKRIPLLDLHAQYAPLRREILAALERVADSQRFILGPEVEAFEREAAAYCGARHAVGVSSGTDALLASLMALGVGPGDDIVTTAYSFFASAGAVARLGARPVFVDIEPATFNLDPAQVRRRLSPRTKAILPVHLFGRCASMGPLEELAAEKGVAIVEDAAQAIGARDERGRAAGTVGRAGCFSFFPSKNLGGFGDGGMVTTDDPAFAEALRQIRAHGGRTKYEHVRLGGNFRLDAIQAAVLRVKLPHLASWTDSRRRNAALYRQALSAAGLTDHILAPADAPGHVYNQFVVRVARRDAAQAFLQARGVETAVYYPKPLPLQPCFAELGHRPGDFPHAEAAAATSFALPVYPELAPEGVAAVVDSLAAFLRGVPTVPPAPAA